ncbi:MAG: hypothetical protein JNJ77_17760 [Planctomycetia bacterium]|nr:hypothetical protein [Planctomycetia bacterium]
MDLDSTGWPELPRVGSLIKFHGGGVLLQCLGKCEVIRADHVTNAVGKPGGRITLQMENGEVFDVTLSQVREHAELIEDGLEKIHLQAAIQVAAKYG